MSKKKAAKDKANQADAGPNGAPDADPLLREAQAKVQQAREELRKAEAHYQKACQTAAENVERLREITVGEVIDEALQWVRKYPGAGLAGAALLGFLFGRWLRR